MKFEDKLKEIEDKQIRRVIEAIGITAKRIGTFVDTFEIEEVRANIGRINIVTKEGNLEMVYDENDRQLYISIKKGTSLDKLSKKILNSLNRNYHLGIRYF